MIPFPNKKYQIIYADPPWSFRPSGSKSATRHYNCMEIEEICDLPVRNIADKNCLLFLWVIFPLLDRAFKVITAWGFKYSTCGFVWVKGKKRFDPNQTSFLPQDSIEDFFGCGMWTRANAEICLIAKRGSIERKSKGVRQIIYSNVRRHSQKPSEARDKIVELCGDLPRIELFARSLKDILFEDESYRGWDVWGEEAGEIIEKKHLIRQEVLF